MFVYFNKILLIILFAIHVIVALEHGHPSLEDTFQHAPILKLKKPRKIVQHGNYKDEWIPGHVVHHSFIPGHVHHVLIPTHEVLLTQHTNQHSIHSNTFKNHIGGFGIGLDSGGHGAGHGYHVWTAYNLK